MSFSNIALQQRERESKALRIFLACSLAGSLVFHLVLLASGIIQYFNRVPEIEEEPVEITLLDTPIKEIEPKEEEKPKPEPEKIEPKQEKPPEAEPLPEPEPEPNITQDTPTESQISGGSQAPRLFEPIPTQPRVVPPPVVEQPPIPKLDIPPIKPISPTQPAPPVVQQQPVIPEPIPQPEEPVLESKLSDEIKIPTTPPIQQPSPISQPEPKFTSPPIEQPSPIPQPDSSELIGSLKQSQENRQPTSNNTTPSLPSTSNTAPTRRRRIIGGSNIATAPNTVDSGIGDGTGDSVGDGDGRAACRQCDTRYPSWASKRKIEGRISVAVDTDAQGNVINVRLISGIGNQRFNKYHEKLAKKWKLKPSANGRKGVIINTTYQIE